MYLDAHYDVCSEVALGRALGWIWGRLLPNSETWKYRNKDVSVKCAILAVFYLISPKESRMVRRRRSRWYGCSHKFLEGMFSGSRVRILSWHQFSACAVAGRASLLADHVEGGSTTRAAGFAAYCEVDDAIWKLKCKKCIVNWCGIQNYLFKYRMKMLEWPKRHRREAIAFF